MANDNKQNPLMRKLPDIVPVRKGVSALKIKMTKNILFRILRFTLEKNAGQKRENC
ncbi:MAG: hypothetical protein ACLVLH_01345 [Eisenbergiella massiliensis]